MDESEGLITVLESIGRTHSRAYSLTLQDSSVPAYNEEMDYDSQTQRSYTSMSGAMSFRSENSLQDSAVSARSFSDSRPGSARYPGQTDSVRFTSTMKTKRSDAVNGSSMFKSRTKRVGFGPTEVPPGVGPGLYDPDKPKWGQGNGVAAMTTNRFPSRKQQMVNTHLATFWEPKRRR